MDWTEESISRLRSLWQDGLSTAEIGRRMQITKNAVVGKAHRLTLPPRPSPIRKGLELASTSLQAQRTVLDGPGAARSMPDDGTPGSAAREPAAAVPAIRPATPAPAPSAREPEPVVVVPEQAVAGNVQVLRPAPARPPAPRPVGSAEDPAPAPLRVVPTASRRSGLTCCWPLGEPGTKAFHFCGGEPTPGKPYCAEHAAIAYVKLRDRRDSVA